MADISEGERAARVIAENVYAAYCQQATMPAHPLEEQTILARLVEAIRPRIGAGSPGEVIDAANAVLSAWEARDPAIRGPRVITVNPTSGAVGVA